MLWLYNKEYGLTWDYTDWAAGSIDSDWVFALRLGTLSLLTEGDQVLYSRGSSMEVQTHQHREQS